MEKDMPQMPPPPGPAPMGPPPAAPGGAPSDEELMAASDAEATERRDMLASAAPNPEKPFTVKKVQTLIGQFNDTIDALGGADLPDVIWEPAEAGPKWNQPIPPEIFAPLMALSEALKAVGGGEFASKYPLDPMALTDDTEVRKASGMLAKMEKDKKLAEAMQAPIGGEPSEEDLPPPPEAEEFSDDESELAEGME